MSPDEIEAAQSPIAGWERATRAFAHTGADAGPAWRDFSDPLDAVAARFRPEARRQAVDRFTAKERHADRKSTRLNSSHGYISYAVFCLKKKKKKKKKIYKRKNIQKQDRRKE